MADPHTYEPQYLCCFNLRKVHGASSFGLMSGKCLIEGPKRLEFVLSRYKFASKVLAGLGRVACPDLEHVPAHTTLGCPHLEQEPGIAQPTAAEALDQTWGGMQ